MFLLTQKAVSISVKKWNYVLDSWRVRQREAHVDYITKDVEADARKSHYEHNFLEQVS